MGTQDKVFNKEVMGKQLRKLRNSTGMNQENFAEKLNLSKDTISNYERGITLIPHDVITILCQKFNVSADFFFFEIDTAQAFQSFAQRYVSGLFKVIADIFSG